MNKHEKEAFGMHEWEDKKCDDKKCDDKKCDDKKCGNKKCGNKKCDDRKGSFPVQTHVHEVSGSTKLADPGDPELRHNHRVAFITSEVIPKGDSHVHAFLSNTDFFFNHLHEVGGETGPAIDIGNGKHIHVIQVNSTINFGHLHEFFVVTSIQNPLV